MSEHSPRQAGRYPGQTISELYAEPHKVDRNVAASHVRDDDDLRKELGKRLREFRRNCRPRITGTAVAGKLGWSQSTVSRIEGTQRPATVAEVDALLDLYGVSGYARTAVLALAATVSGQGSWTVAADLAGRQRVIASAELDGGRLRHFQPTLVPGVLQTADYARAVAAGHGGDPEEIVEARLRRRQALAASMTRYDVVVDARVLLGGPGDSEIRRQQALALTRPPASPRWTIRVIPIGTEYPKPAGAGFTICDFSDPRIAPIVWTESVGFDIYHADPSAVESFASLFDSLRGISLTAAESTRYLEGLADGL